MFCNNCGTELPEEANFCSNCGKPQKPDVLAEVAKWETCEIERGIVGKSGIFRDNVFAFNAKAIGPQGVYTAGESSQFIDIEHAEEKKIVEDLINKLVESGWEPTGSKGSSWWAHRFRRRIK